MERHYFNSQSIHKFIRNCERFTIKITGHPFFNASTFAAATELNLVLSPLSVASYNFNLPESVKQMISKKFDTDPYIFTSFVKLVHNVHKNKLYYIMHLLIFRIKIMRNLVYFFVFFCTLNIYTITKVK